MSIHSFIEELHRVTAPSGLSSNLRRCADFESVGKVMVRESNLWVSSSLMRPCADFEAGLLKKNKVNGEWHTHLPPEWKPPVREPEWKPEWEPVYDGGW